MTRSVLPLVLASMLASDASAQSRSVGVLRLSFDTARVAHEFSSIDGIRELPDGRVLVVDSRDRAVLVADFRTSRVRQVGRSGNGPGEYRAPLSIFAGPGDSSMVFDGGQSALLYIDGSGVFGRQESTASLSASGGGTMSRFIPRAVDSTAALYHTETAFRATPQGIGLADSVAIRRWTRSGPSSAPIAYVRVRSASDRGGAVGSGGTIPFVVGDQWAVSGDGRIAILRWDEYRVDFVLPDGTRSRGPVLPYERVPVTAEERAEWRRQRPAAAEPPRWPDFLPPFLTRSAFFASDGLLWVARTVAAGAPASFDIIDQRGQRVRQVRLEAPGRLLGFGRSYAYVAQTDEDGLETLRRVRVP
jgi:hypothetical protein